MQNGPAEHECEPIHRVKSGWTQRIAAVLFLIGAIAVWVTMDSTEPRPYQDQFFERFASNSCNSHWNVSNHWRTNGLSLLQDSNRGGIYFEARTMGRWRSADDFAFATWPVESDSFCLNFAVEIDNGRLQKYFEAGVAVALCPKLPDQMTDKDLCIVIQVSYAGIGMAVWRGWFLNSDAQQVSQTTHDVNGLESVPWHMQYLRDVHLKFSIQRQDSELVMSVTSSELPEIQPWHIEHCDLSTIDGNFLVRNIVVQRVPVKEEHLGYPDFEIRGRVYDFEGYLLNDPPPTVSRVQITEEPDGAGMSAFLEGKYLEAIDWVQIGLFPRQSVTQRSDTHLNVSLANLRLPDGIHHVVLGNGNRSWPTDISVKRGAKSLSFSPTEVNAGDEIELTSDSSHDKISGVTIGGVSCETLATHEDGRMRFRVPDLPRGSHGVSVRLSNRTMELTSPMLVRRHPTLLWNEKKRADLKTRFHAPDFVSYKNRIVEAAKKGNDPLSLLVVAELNDDFSAQEQLLDSIRKICRERGAVRFDAAHWAKVAIVYDTLFPKLSTADRDLMRRYLEFVLKYYSLSHDDWFFLARHNPSNTVAIANTGGGLAALALLGTHPEAERLAKLARQRLTEFVSTTVRRDGGYIEGTLYWDYAMTSYLHFLTAWRNSGLSTDADHSDAGLEMMPNYVAAILGGDGRMVTFNDTQPWLTGLPTIAFLGNEYELPWLDATADYLVSSGHSDATSAFLWRSSRSLDPRMPLLPTSSVLPISQLLTFRSSPIWSSGATLSISGTHGRMSHHKQADQAGLIYSLDGRPVLIDPGYYQPTADDHSVMIINGQGPIAGVSSALVEATSAGTTHFALFDLTDCYRIGKTLNTKHDTAQISRAFLMHGQEVVVLDQVECRNGSLANTLLEQIQLHGRPRLVSNTSRWTAYSVGVGSASEVEIRFWGEDWTSSIEGPRDFEQSWIFRRMAEASEIAWYSLTAEHAFRQEFTSIWSLTSQESSLDVGMSENGHCINCRFSDGETIMLHRSERGWLCDAIKREQPSTGSTKLAP
jgi:hypothetical protein